MCVVLGMVLNFDMCYIVRLSSMMLSMMNSG